MESLVDAVLPGRIALLNVARCAIVSFVVFFSSLYVASFVRKKRLDKRYSLKALTHAQIVKSVRRFTKRSMDKTSVNVDLPRLCRRIQIFNDGLYVGGGLEGDTESHDRESEDVRSRNEVCWDILHSLATCFHDETFLGVLKDNKKWFLAQSHDLLSNDLGALLGMTKRDPDSFQLLKIVNQGIIAPVIIDFKRRLSGLIPHRDVNCSWKVIVNLGCSSSSASDAEWMKGLKYCHRVHHKKRSDDVDGRFHFVWNCIFFLDKKLRVVDFRAFVSDVAFDKPVEEAECELLLSLFRAYDEEHS